MTSILDTAIIVDALRGYPPARTWLASQDRLGVTAVTWLEIIEGAMDSAAQRSAIALLRHFERIAVMPEDFDWAIQQVLRFRLSHQIDIMDCLIAATAHRLEVPLYTRNLKHFSPLLGALARRPY